MAASLLAFISAVLFYFLGITESGVSLAISFLAAGLALLWASIGLVNMQECKVRKMYKIIAKTLIKKGLNFDFYLLLITTWYLICTMSSAFVSYTTLSVTIYLILTFIPFHFTPNLAMHCVIEAGDSSADGLHAKKVFRIICGFLGSIALIMLMTVNLEWP